MISLDTANNCSYTANQIPYHSNIFLNDNSFKVMRQFSAVKRLERKLQLMAYMSSFDQNITSLRPQIAIVTSASRNLKSNTKIKKILEIILAFGNYMNSAKKGPCYGFKLSSLDSLTITKSGTDKQRNLLNYIVDMINKKYPELKNFHTELNFIKVRSNTFIFTI